jgi:hypothetical protein
MNRPTGPRNGRRQYEGFAGYRLAAFVLLVAVVAAFAGCIERTVSINTEPEDAVVFLNDQEVGRSPVKVPFTWYGDYDIIIRKPGYKTVQTHEKLNTPWYALPGLDIITECLVPFTIHDDRVVDTVVLEPSERPTDEAMLQAAAEMRERALSESDGS